MLSDRCLSACPDCLPVTLVYCGQTVGWIKMKHGMQVGLGPGHIVLDGDPAPLPKKGADCPSFTTSAPPFSADIFCGQMAGGIMTKLGMQVGLGPGHIVLNGVGTQLPLPKRGRSPTIFGPCLLWPNGWVDQDSTVELVPSATFY